MRLHGFAQELYEPSDAELEGFQKVLRHWKRRSTRAEKRPALIIPGSTGGSTSVTSASGSEGLRTDEVFLALSAFDVAYCRGYQYHRGQTNVKPSISR
jgi:hypothetical protein